MFLHDLTEAILQFLFETAIDSVVSSKRGERLYGCACFLVCCLLMLILISVLVAAS